MKEVNLIKNNFERLLAWLDDDRDIAGQKYECVRARLIKIFEMRGCLSAEELADETINRVTEKIDQIVGGYQGDPALYFLGVARNVCRESFRRAQPVELPENIVDARALQQNETDVYYQCLQKCLRDLTPEQREFILAYYAYQNSQKIEMRHALAEKLNITIGVAHTKAFRIRVKLEACITKCVKNS